MELVPLLLLLLSLVVEVTMKRKQGCFTPANISCNDTTLSCGHNQIIEILNIQLKGTCNQTGDFVELLNNTTHSYQFTYKDAMSISKQCSSQQSCTIVSPHGVNKRNKTSGLYAYIKYTYRCLDVPVKETQGCFSPANISCNDTTLSCGDNQNIEILNIQLIGTCNQTDDCVGWLNNTRRSHQFTYKDVISINKQCSSQQSCTIVSPHGVNKRNKTSGQYAYIKYTYRCLDDPTRSSSSSTDVVTMDTTRTSSDFTSTNPPHTTDAKNETGGDSVITTVVVTVTVVIVVEAVVVLIVILIYRKRRIKTVVNTDRTIKTNKTTDAYEEITNVNGYETVVDPGLKSHLSFDKPIKATVTDLVQRIEAGATEPIYRKEAVITEPGKTSKTNTPVYHILQPDDDVKLPHDRKSDLKPGDTYDHIRIKKPKRQDQNRPDTLVPSNHFTARTSYENIELDSCNMKDGNRVDNSTYSHLYSDNNHTQGNGVTRSIDGTNVTTNLNDDDTYNHLHDTTPREIPDVSLDIRDDNSATRPDAMNDNSVDNDTYNHLYGI